mmetsp:Transcript_32314/g.57942  ORF Transcript_32314/g.57942 Transcript_32314/m.57942 type:complete len:269 (+) Transcript_32314:116-922(+)|eukprot:CAMPEP_0115117144 /NCGR_PEP_ID=MMETSP0227-20121206/43706_1 /TAXON_ID=89957 /ORGANISM="Polarella glacialis, Strain CCMP 1383" /LENGTH=268 /DNA_ID=CAMNT_0002518137 /DNA_START=108 /DNA_END=914 /DNA_ORIENTATION=-
MALSWRPRQEERSADIGPDDARLFVGGLPYSCLDEELAFLAEQIAFDMPSSMCQLLECRCVAGKGIGFLQYSSWDAASTALKALDQRRVEGRDVLLNVKWSEHKGKVSGFEKTLAKSRGEVDTMKERVLHMMATDRKGSKGSNGGKGGKKGSSDGAAAGSGEESEQSVVGQGLDSNRLFVNHLNKDLKDKDVMTAAFKPFGEIESLRWFQMKGIAYVKYARFEDARAALNALAGKHLPVLCVKASDGLDVSYAQSKDARDKPGKGKGK